jgi:hypothetical protein
MPLIPKQIIKDLMATLDAYGCGAHHPDLLPLLSEQATKLPEPIFTKITDDIEIGYNLWGGALIRLGGEFTYVQINYNHEYTDNATRTRLAENIVKLIQGQLPHPTSPNMGAKK